MINLSSPQQKQRLLGEEHLRLILILGVLFSSFLISLSLVLILVKNYTSWNLETQEILLQEKEKIISLNQDLEKEIEESNIFLSNLSSFYQERINLTQVLEKIYETLPSETYLTGFGFGLSQKRGEKRAQISLVGFSPNRETLLVFKENLEDEKGFSEVYFSPQSWVKPTEIIFNVTFKLN